MTPIQEIIPTVMERVNTRSVIWRLLVIHKRIAAGGYPNANTLARDLEYSPRTIQRDIEWARDMLGAPVRYDQWRRGYYYDNPRWLEGVLCTLHT